MTLTITAAVSTDTGCRRTLNEDAARIAQPLDPEVRAARGVLAVVADGMGGHSAGEVASQMAVETIHREYYAASGTTAEALASAIALANDEIFERARHDSALTGMGTTCVALALCGGHAHAAHVGDSRLYLVRGGRIYQMTEDHSAVAALVNQGVISRAEARTHEDKNVILRALGTHPKVEISSWEQPFPVAEGDVFLLASDGLTDLVEDDELFSVAATRNEADACRALVDLARTRGGFDNITVAVLRASAAASETRPVPATREIEVGR